MPYPDDQQKQNDLYRIIETIDTLQSSIGNVNSCVKELKFLLERYTATKPTGKSPELAHEKGEEKENLPPISKGEIEGLDIDELIGKLKDL